MISELKQSYQSGALKPDVNRIAERLIEWGFDLRREESL
jgi:hypothetical protein